MATTTEVDVLSRTSLPSMVGSTNPATMTAVRESFSSSSSPHPIPSPVCLDDDNVLKTSYNPAAALPGPPTSFRFQRVPPSPIPDFVFPAQPSSGPSPYPRTSGRRPKSVADLYNDHGSLSYGLTGNAPMRTSRSPALPDFSFNPGANLPPAPGHAFLSPPQSPQSPRIVPARHGGAGHRRGGSEFVGGSLRHGEAFTLMSTSPTKSDSDLSSPQPSPLANSSTFSGAKPPLSTPGRRGHAHRRSAAISSHDISDILQPSSPAPTTQGVGIPQRSPDFELEKTKKVEEKIERALSEEKVMDSSTGPTILDAEVPDGVKQTVISQKVSEFEGAASKEEAAIGQQHVSPIQRMSTQRTRVGFSDTLEFIPRPLSLVSSDTSSTVTARPSTGNHSVSGSISSITSLNASVAAGIELDGFSSYACTSPHNVTDSRPSTAGAVLDRTQQITANDMDCVSSRRRNSIPFLVATPADSGHAEATAQALPSVNRASKRWSFFSLDPFIGSGSNTLNWPARSCASDSPVLVDEPVHTPISSLNCASSPKSLDQSADSCIDITMEDAVTNDDDVASALRTVARKSSSSKKKKKARTWGILGRKSKPRRKSRRAPTPPPPKTEADSDSDELVDPHFTAMDPIIAEPPAVNELSATTADSGTPCGPPQTELRDDLWIWQPAQTLPPSKLDDDTSFAVIDMDAALGPFNTPLPRDAEWEAAQRAGGLSIRQLHSAAGMTRFSGPGMHYSHRRAESAPEMPPFNRSGISRFNNSTAMDDVFEEDEEEDDGNKGSSKCQPVEATAGKQKGVVRKATSLSSTPSTPSTRPCAPAEFPEHSENLGICASPPDSVQSSSRDQAMDLNSTEWDDPALPAALSRRSSGRSETDDSSNDDRLQPIVGDKAEISASSLPNDVVVEEDGLSRFKFGDGYDFVMDSSSDSTLHLPGRLMKGKHLSQLDVSPLRLPNTGSPAPISPYTMAPSHVFESAPSSLSYDAGRILKAHSPVDKDNFESLLLGEPGPEVRVSSDIPSLTSSNSTMTRESTVPQAPQYPNIGGQPRPFLPSRVNERPASFTSTAFGRRRSSLASLHRLISTSHGERSKLSIEVQIDGGDASNTREGDKTAKSSKTKRISRMMQFWRGKDEATT